MRTPWQLKDWYVPMLFVLGIMLLVLVFMQLPTTGVYSDQNWDTMRDELIFFLPYLVVFALAFLGFVLVVKKR